MLVIDPATLNGLSEEQIETIEAEVRGVTLASRLVGAFLFVDHLGLEPDDYGWANGYDPIALEIANIHLDPAYDREDEPKFKWDGEPSPEAARNRVKSQEQHSKLLAIFARYKIVGILKARITYILEH